MKLETTPKDSSASKPDERAIQALSVKESHASSSAESAEEPSAGVPTTPAHVLRTWSTIEELHSWLRGLGAPSYGTKDVSFRRL